MIPLEIFANYGRLYVRGPGKSAARKIPGAAYNDKRQAYEVSLTLETLRLLRRASQTTQKEFAAFLSPDVLAWAVAAGKSEAAVKELHAKLDTGWRVGFPWDDNQGDEVTGAYRPPLDHQKVLATAAVSLDGVAFLATMGTMKTRAALEAIRYKLDHADIDVAVVICKRGGMGTWQRECAMWTKGIATHLLIDMTVPKRIKAIEAFDQNKGKQIFVINYDVVAKMQEVLLALCRVYRVGLFMDEVHKIRNPRAGWSEACMTLAQHSRWHNVMTGSPILQGGQDIWSQWYVVDLGQTFGANNVQFRREHFDENPYDFKITPKKGALEKIAIKMRDRGWRYTKDVLSDLPPKTYAPPIEVEMTKEQAKAYMDMEEDLVAILGGEKDDDTFEDDEEDKRPFATAANQLAMLMRVTQITSGFVKTSTGGIHLFDPNPKLDALYEMVEENIREQQMIVWARYRVDHEMIAKRLEKWNPQIIRGGVSQKARDEIEVGFQKGKYRLLVASPGAAGESLNLYAASLAAYYSQDYNLDFRIQSEDRSHRQGSQMHKKITFVDFHAVFPGGRPTRDREVSEALSGKKSVADFVVDLKRSLGIAA